MDHYRSRSLEGMSEDAKRVLAGFATLSLSDQEEVGREIDRYFRSDHIEKRALRENFQYMGRVVLGPVTRGCPCCGR